MLTPAKLERFLVGAAKRGTARLVFLVVEFLGPKHPARWSFGTWPGRYGHTLDNPRAVFEIVKADPNIQKVVLLRDGQTVELLDGANVVFANVESVRGAYLLATSGVVIVGYGLSGLASYGRMLTSRHRVIQLWHGIPLKRIGRMVASERWWPAETHKYAATVCSSEPDRAAMVAAFDPIPGDRVWKTGLPRNDFLLSTEADLPADYRRRIDDLRERLRGRRLVLYAPTWRNNSSGAYRFTPKELEALTETLIKHNAVLATRAHGIVRADTNASRDGADTLMSVDDFPDVSVVLRLTDVLITDYSSIYIDFLLAARPIIHFAHDLDSYVRERGFIYQTDDAFASPACLTFDQMLNALSQRLESAYPLHPMHARATALFHDHAGNAARAVSERICALVALPAPDLERPLGRETS